ncbi:DUF222 domain-containing protein [Microbacterium sp. SSW1-59]|uniref:HNH endonuclease signature motif containing protein n=1 Tax=Microbacterium xanthum TaxID=3079794 RepID=UPI002AD4FB5B|nr:DUF222 domain-containing protein [Microbacterium sp. SSW1-59]MDZ8200968.1 DUF222 domain-containing protein [Microbacterium sp. SSW1-59]
MAIEEPREAEMLRTRELIAEIAAFDAAEARIQAERARLYAEAYDLTQRQTDRLRDASTREREMPLRAMAAEIAVAKRVSDRTMQTHLFEAHRTVTEFAATWEAWHAGRVSRAHVKVIVDTGTELTEREARESYEHDVLAYAEKTSPARVRSYAEQVAEKLDPKSMQERHDDALLDRRVWVEDLRDGMSMLGAIGPSVEVHGVYDRLTRQGKAIKAADRGARRAAVEQEALDGESEPAAPGVPVDPGAGRVGANAPGWFDDRSMDHIRTDLLLDMMLTASPSVDSTAIDGGLGAIRAHVQVTVPATTLAGTTSGGAQLNGKCAVDPETAKVLAGHAPGFDRVFLDPISSAVLAVDRRLASAAQRRYLVARDIRCRFPGCRRPALECDADHREDWAGGGSTDIDNLGAFCKRHHTLKHAAGWTVTQLPGGRLHFTAPSLLEYTDDPPPRVMFTPDLDNKPGDADPPEAKATAAPF